jgi:hypothetical protein
VCLDFLLFEVSWLSLAQSPVSNHSTDLIRVVLFLFCRSFELLCSNDLARLAGRSSLNWVVDEDRRLGIDAVNDTSDADECILTRLGRLDIVSSLLDLGKSEEVSMMLVFAL